MALYKYRAKKGPDGIVEDTIEAPSQRNAVEKIEKLGYLPVRVEECVRAPRRKPNFLKQSAGGRIRSKEITVFSRQLATLLRSGVPILNALNIIIEQSGNPHFKSILAFVYDAIKDGATFSSTLRQFPAVFPFLYVALIRTGEDSGTLPQALVRISDYRVKQEEMLSRFRMALAYPVLMAIVGVGTIIFMLTFVMPRLKDIFTSMGQNLPLPTRLLIFASQGLLHEWIWIVLAFLGILWVYKQQARTNAGKLFLSRVRLRLPFISEFMLKAELARFSRTLELLVKSGIPILKAIDLGIFVLDNEVVKDQMRKSYKELEQGGSLGKSLKNSKLFPIFMTNLISVGEESGKLEEALAEVAYFYEADTDEAIRILGSLLEPLMILVIGLVVGFIVTAMLLPVFEMNTMAR